ncbi:hypothetical protein BLNAU_4100 [Blattamonas nauphoetae]|uniref:Uncharacterized protein n=1 Tax=Blattamonas nauphoetae TaxID=2049346 RepID=A0ABQ9YBF7_9EUKA|nr:hypothetical protein BLNAU_4100 [Blattamonas nauphoetae]
MSEINEEEIVKKIIDVSQHFSRLLPFDSRPADQYRSPVQCHSGDANRSTIPRNSSIACSSSSLFAAEFNTSTGLIRSDSVTTLPPSTCHPSVGIVTTTDTMDEGMLRNEESMELDADLSGVDLSDEEVRNVIAACLDPDHFNAPTTRNHQ